MKGFIAGFALAVALVSGLFALPAAAQNAETLIAPRLNTPIPGLDFSKFPAYRSGQNITIPFLSAYITVAYTYVTGIGIIAAAVIIIYAGFQYIIGSSIAKIGRAKELITDAVIGLVILLGSYVILNTVSPVLTILKPITVQSIKRIPFEFSYNVSISNEVLTGTTPDAPPSQSPGIGTTGPITDCPFTLEAPLDLYTQSITKDPRNMEFFSKVKPLLEGKTFADRAKLVGDAAAACKITLGSCGSSALYLLGLASKAFAPCLTGTTCDYAFMSKNSKAIHGASSAARQIMSAHCWGDKACGPPKPGCTPAGELLPKIRSEFPSAMGDGYPESWMKDLQPGDWLYVYSGNPSCSGEHSIVFNGWANIDTGMAHTIQGPGFKKLPGGGSIGTVVVEKDVCLSSKCGNYMPMTLVIRPNP